MFEFAIALPLLMLLLWRPLVIPYLLLLYMVINGYASRPFMAKIVFSFGSVNVFPLDFLYATVTLLIPVYFLLRFAHTTPQRRVSREVRLGVVLVSLYLAWHVSRLAIGVLSGVPFDALIRMFASDTQAVYFFLPLMFVKSEQQLRRLLRFTVVIALLFPFGQPFLVGSDDYELISKGQGTLRLGFGDSSIFEALGLFALLAWERSLMAAALPVASIIMLAHRSAFIGVVISIVMMFVLKRKPLKSLLIIGFAGILGGAMLFTVEMVTSQRVLEKGAERLGETFKTTGTTSARLMAIPQLLEAWSENPVAGLSYSELHSLQKRAEFSGQAFNILHSHNFVLTSLVQSGAIGSLLLFTIIGYTLICAKRLSRIDGQRNTGAFLFASLLFFLIFSTMNTSLQTVGFVFWFLGGTVFWYMSVLGRQAIQRSQNTTPRHQNSPGLSNARGRSQAHPILQSRNLDSPASAGQRQNTI